jgi:hypothetical protein
LLIDGVGGRIVEAEARASRRSRFSQLFRTNPAKRGCVRPPAMPTFTVLTDSLVSQPCLPARGMGGVLIRALETLPGWTSRVRRGLIINAFYAQAPVGMPVARRDGGT